MPPRAKTLFRASETPCTYGIEMKAEYVSGLGDKIEDEIQSDEQEIDCHSTYG